MDEVKYYNLYTFTSLFLYLFLYLDLSPSQTVSFLEVYFRCPRLTGRRGNPEECSRESQNGRRRAADHLSLKADWKSVYDKNLRELSETHVASSHKQFHFPLRSDAVALWPEYRGYTSGNLGPQYPGWEASCRVTTQQSSRSAGEVAGRDPAATVPRPLAPTTSNASCGFWH